MGDSVYKNPGWPDAVWDVSGAFVNDRELIAFYDFCKLLLGYEPFRIVHGAPLCVWNSGRVLKHLLRDAEEIRTAGLAYEQRGIAMYLTFTNLLLQEKDLNDKLGEALLIFCTNHNPGKRNAVIAASDVLRDHVRRNYPDLRLVSSILKITNEHGRGKEEVYRRLAEEYDEVMVHPDDVLNYPLLEKLEDKKRYILLINEYCVRQCPIRHLHYAALSRQAKDFLNADNDEFDKRQASNGCRSLYTLLTDAKHGVLALNTPEIQRLRDMGFRHFKLQGRGHANASGILFDLIRLAWRNDGPDENAMHALGHRFWESLLPDETA